MATRRGLLRQLEAHQRRLEALEVQQAQAGPGGPISVQIEIEDEKRAIREIAAELDALDANSKFYLNGDRVDSEKQARMDAQLSRIENKLDAVNDRVYGLSARITSLERDMQEMSDRMTRLENQVALLQHGPQTVTRTWLLSGAVLLAAVFLLVLFMAWRLL